MFSDVGMKRKSAIKTSGLQKKRAKPRVTTASDQVLAALDRYPNVGLAICDRQLRFESINSALASMNGIPAEAHIGKTIRDILGGAAAKIEPLYKKVFLTGDPVLNVQLSARLPTRNEPGYWIESCFPIKDASGEVQQVAGFVVEVTEEKKLRESLRSLTGKLLRHEDFKQRRVARELHDSLNQYHAGLKMQLAQIGRCETAQQRAKLVASAMELLKECMQDTQTICHLLHPPALDLVGFVGAAQQYVRGFSKRSGMHVKLKVPSKLPRLPEVVEIALYRVLQEALINAYRHSRSPAIDIAVARKAGSIVLWVRDYGHGMSAKQLERLEQLDTSAGVGLARMRERVHDLGGQFEIRSGKNGTLVSVALPVSYAS
jgi:signal transduction histidine kinase